MGEKRAVITYNTWDSRSAELAGQICALLQENGVTPLVYDKLSEFDRLVGAAATDDVSDCICMITVGGDGTILHWGKLMARHGKPLLGVNTGRLGFMATLEPSDIGRIPQLILGDFSVSRRMLMQAEILKADGTAVVKTALNDVVIERDRLSKLPEFRVFSGDTEVLKLQADGVIFGTPTGSTAYSLSAGGPIIAPDMECIECTPLCPHTLFSRPMIFSVSRPITLSCTPYQGSRVTISVDGERGIPFEEGDRLRLTRSEGELRIIEAGDGFFGAVRNKLMTPLK